MEGGGSKRISCLPNEAKLERSRRQGLSCVLGMLQLPIHFKALYTKLLPHKHTLKRESREREERVVPYLQEFPDTADEIAKKDGEVLPQAPEDGIGRAQRGGAPPRYFE